MMTPTLRRRLLAFCAAIAALVLLAGWSAFTSWREIGTLREHFTGVQFESFRIAGQLQSDMLALNSALLAYEIGGGSGDWARYQQESGELNAWIDRQRGVLKTLREKRVLAEIDAEYDRYLAVAQAIQTERSARTNSSVTRIHQLDEAAKRMFALAARLADAHSAALGDLLGQSQHSLQRLETLFGGGFLLMLAVGGWGARVLFQETIAPLRLQLIEAHALAERQEKLASLGLLAAGVAHEIRNPLTGIKLRAYSLRHNLSDETSAREDLNVIDREIDRLARIVSDFLRFANPGDPKLAPVTPRELFQETRTLLAPELAAQSIELCVESGRADGESLRADPGQLKQVLINLVRNAAESIGRDGRVTLRACPRRLPLRGIAQPVLVLEVEDTGGGIPADVQERLFDPFFTTKETGTGLGLSIAMRILERHGGTLQFQTAPGHGTTFGLVLPVPITETQEANEPAGVASPPIATANLA